MCAADSHPPSGVAGSGHERPRSYEGLARIYSEWRSEYFLSDSATAFLEGLPTEGALALDAGCGPGLVSEALAGRVGHLVAFDVSPSMVLISRRRLADAGASNVSLLVADAAALPFRGATIDLVVAYHLLHLTDMERTLPELAAVMKPSGTFFIADSVRNEGRLRNGALGAVWLAIRWPVGELLAGHTRQARRLARLLWSPRWLRTHVRKGYTGSSFSDCCRRHLPDCRVKLTKTWIDVRWTATSAPAPPR